MARAWVTLPPAPSPSQAGQGVSQPKRRLNHGPRGQVTAAAMALICVDLSLDYGAANGFKHFLRQQATYRRILEFHAFLTRLAFAR